MHGLMLPYTCLCSLPLQFLKLGCLVRRDCSQSRQCEWGGEATYHVLQKLGSWPLRSQRESGLVHLGGMRGILHSRNNKARKSSSEKAVCKFHLCGMSKKERYPRGYHKSRTVKRKAVCQTLLSFGHWETQFCLIQHSQLTEVTSYSCIFLKKSLLSLITGIPK